jgi:hypothetical protein
MGQLSEIQGASQAQGEIRPQGWAEAMVQAWCSELRGVEGERRSARRRGAKSTESGKDEL